MTHTKADSIKDLASRLYKWWLFAFNYLVVQTDEGEIIKGGTFFVAGRAIFTIGYADGPWIDDDDKIIRFSFTGKDLIIRRLWVMFGDDE